MGTRPRILANAGRPLSVLAAGLLALATACGGDLVLDKPDRRPPNPRCDDGFVLDPDEGWCVPAGCTSDDDCLEGQRCDLIEGACVPKPPCGPDDPPDADDCIHEN